MHENANGSRVFATVNGIDTTEYERGIREILLHSFIKLARFYGVSLDKLAENASVTENVEKIQKNT